MQATYGSNEISSLLSKVRIFNKEIGTYEIFAITDRFDYAVKLSNGKILLKIEELQDDARDALTPERLTAIANRFVSSTQTTTQQEASQAPQAVSKPVAQKRNNSSGRTILLIVITLIIIVAGFAVLKNTNSSKDSGSYKEKVMTVEEIERSQPTNFLTANGTYNKGFWGDKLNVHGVINNSATVATYKDAVVRVTYYSKTKTVLGSKDYVIYEVFSPHTSKNFELKIDNYKDVDSIGWNVIRAVAI